MTLLVAVLTGFIVSQVANLATTVYLHRGLAHRAVTIRGPLAFSCRFLLWITTGLKAREWAAVHRKHHAFTDTPDDPHSPAQTSWLRVQLANAAMYRRVARTPGNTERYARDLPADKWDKALFDHGFVGLAIGIGALIVLFGPLYGLIAAVVHTVVYLAIGGAVNGIGHTYGKRPYDNSATNNQWLAFLSGGEGLHNNHHAAPTSARLSLHKGEIDFGWWAIKAARLVGLAKVRLDQPKLARPNRRQPVAAR